MEDKEHAKPVSAKYNIEWPTPAEAAARTYSKNTSKVIDSPMDCSTRERLPGFCEQSSDISFLQPSVVYPLPHTDEGEQKSELASKGTDVEIPSPNPQIHIWSETLDEYMDAAKEIHPALLSQLKPCVTKDDDNCLYNATCLCLGCIFCERILRSV